MNGLLFLHDQDEDQVIVFVGLVPVFERGPVPCLSVSISVSNIVKAVGELVSSR